MNKDKSRSTKKIIKLSASIDLSGYQKSPENVLEEEEFDLQFLKDIEEMNYIDKLTTADNNDPPEHTLENYNFNS